MSVAVTHSWWKFGILASRRRCNRLVYLALMVNFKLLFLKWLFFKWLFTCIFPLSNLFPFKISIKNKWIWQAYVHIDSIDMATMLRVSFVQLTLHIVIILPCTLCLCLIYLYEINNMMLFNGFNNTILHCSPSVTYTPSWGQNLFSVWLHAIIVTTRNQIFLGNYRNPVKDFILYRMNKLNLNDTKLNMIFIC